MYNDFADLVNRCIDDSGFTVKEFAQQKGLPLRTVYGYTEGETVPYKMDAIIRLAKALNIPMGELVWCINRTTKARNHGLQEGD